LGLPGREVMRLKARIVAVGEPDEDLWAYEQRLRRKGRGLMQLDLVEVSPSRAKTPAARLAEEAKRLQAVLCARFVLLDPKGELLKSEDWAKRWVQLGGRIELLIGGPDGVHERLAAKAAMRWSLSPLVFSHRLARAIVVEQLFRAAAIVAGHPYHRAS